MKYQAKPDNICDLSDRPLSKTKRKEQMQALQNLGIQLAQLTEAQLTKFTLPDNLRDAIKLAQKINSNGALRRQYQYIGKLMRNVDELTIEDRLAEINNESAKNTKLLHLGEKWRERLLENDSHIEEFIRHYPKCEITELRTLIRQVRRELAKNEPRNYRKLFKFIRELIEGDA